MRHVLSTLGCAAVLLGAMPAQAQTDLSVERFEEGVEALQQSRFDEAATAFRESYRLAPRVTTMCNLALTYDRWGERQERAVRAYRTCARDDDTGRFGAFAERRVQELEREIALTEVEVAQVEVAQVEVAQVEVTERPDPILETPDVPPDPVALPPQNDHALLWVGVGSAALAAGAFTAGLVLALDAQRTVDELRRQLGPSPTVVRGSDEHRRLDYARDAATAATVLYVSAGIAAAAGATFIVVDLVTDESPTGATAQLRPTGTGARLEGHF